MIIHYRQAFLMTPTKPLDGSPEKMGEVTKREREREKMGEVTERERAKSRVINKIMSGGYNNRH